MYDYKGKRALVTGASSGIGASFAQALAQRGMNLVLVARSEDKMRKLADELKLAHGVEVVVIGADLSQTGSAKTVYEATQRQNLPIDMLVNNAGFSTFGGFDTIPAAKEQEEIAVNVASLVDMTHAFLPAMLAKGDGAILNVASTGAFLSLPRQAVYGATKAFVLSFSEALYEEYRKRGVRIFALCPGPVATQFAEVAEVDFKTKAATPQQVVEAGLKAFERGRHYVIPGAMNYVQANLLPRLLPRNLLVRLVEVVSRQVIQPRASGQPNKAG
ncbi:MAG: SDR family oxidoreductase [Herpetosiphonaceae bacterium]|nr:SDR family oxidoreductase [Herpetosiphonaceae bacterium]